jgi:DNA-binding CsgD family transcriptional regulator
VVFDAVGVIECLYRTDLVGSAWLLAVMNALQPLLDPDHRGVHGGFYDCPDPFSFVPEAPVTLGMSDALRSVFEEGMHTLRPAFIAGTFLAPGLVSGALVEGWNDIAAVRNGRFRAHGLLDVLNVVAAEPDGSGCAISNFRAEPVQLRGAEGHLIRGLFRHFTVAHRLQRKLRSTPILLDHAEAILDPNGRVQHATGRALPKAALARLRSAADKAHASRLKTRRSDPHAALGAWDSLVAGRWTLVDHFESDGRRYILALENAQPVSGVRALSPREREVLTRALEGSDNKVIAYDLGISHATVRVLMARAASKLGVRTRSELVAKFSRGA